MNQADPSPRRAPARAHYDAVVLGSGLGGATCALRLAERGLNVLIVERGRALSPDIENNPTLQSRYILDEAPDRSLPLEFVGGQTKFFGAALYRFRESDFEAVEHEAGMSPAWPVGYGELEPYYCAAEALYKVHGADASDPTDPVRSRPFPYPAVPYAPLVAAFADRLTRKGAVVSPVPRGVDFGPGGKCVNCAACDGFYCARDAKMDAEIAAVRPALATGRAELLVGATCTTLTLDASGSRVTGGILRCDDREFTVTADAVISAGGLQGTAELFLRSRTPAHPSGLGNNRGQLGRNLAGHSTNMIFPLVSLKTLPDIQTKSFALNAFYNGAPDWPFPLGVVQVAGRMPIWRDTSRLLRPAVRLVAAHCLTLFHMTEAPPLERAGFVFDGDRVVGKVDPAHSLGSINRLRTYAVRLLADAGCPSIARRRTPYLWHEVGTTRMGEDPNASVVDRFGMVHGIAGLYVADAGVLPTAGAVNTGLTIAALALRTADHIAAA